MCSVGERGTRASPQPKGAVAALACRGRLGSATALFLLLLLFCVLE